MEGEVVLGLSGRRRESIPSSPYLKGKRRVNAGAAHSNPWRNFLIQATQFSLGAEKVPAQNGAKSRLFKMKPGI
jgi:hypothetical protein